MEKTPFSVCAIFFIFFRLVWTKREVRIDRRVCFDRIPVEFFTPSHHPVSPEAWQRCVFISKKGGSGRKCETVLAMKFLKYFLLLFAIHSIIMEEEKMLFTINRKDFWNSEKFPRFKKKRRRRKWKINKVQEWWKTNKDVSTNISFFPISFRSFLGTTARVPPAAGWLPAIIGSVLFRRRRTARRSASQRQTKSKKKRLENNFKYFLFLNWI